ncbi:unnamed protein product [Tetraodon nigroviridis]|uniref:CD59 glycoprotein n=1 Tax=Tetraodon nigroviridis TaxID=99883 RepID=Q4RLC0_TETNG|nr:unnamed protein product [Tetraodon nigroviridis]
MRCPALLCLAVGLAALGCAISLECYSCSGESPDHCGETQQCGHHEDSCLKLTSNGMIYAGCIRYSDCNFLTLGSKYVLPDFTFSCCQSNLCNKKKKKNWLTALFG